MSRENPSNIRKTYFIKKDFQVRFILKFCLLLVAGVVVSTGLLFFFSRDSLTSSFQHSRLVVENTSQAILPTVIYTSLVTMGILAIATVIVTLFISHKIAGPMFRFEQDLKEIGNGNLSKKVILRKKDQATAMAACINDMTTGLHEKVSHLQAELERITVSARSQKAPAGIVEELESLHLDFTKTFKL